MKAYHLFLIRHGMTQGNDEGRYIGVTDQPLSARGEQALRDLAARYPYPQADIFFTSPLQRCRRTLEILYPGAQAQAVPGLREIDFGRYENKTLPELKNEPGFDAWLAAKGSEAAPGGESAEAFQKRCCEAFAGIVDALLRSGQTRAAVCAHGGTIMSILGAFGYPRRPFYSWMTGNGRGYEIVVTPQLWMSAQAFDIAAAIPAGAPESGLGGVQQIIETFQKEMEK